MFPTKSREILDFLICVSGFFKGFNFALLGDIHKMQTMQEYKQGRVTKPVVRYCGSLVQQNHGETLTGHGLSVWNVKDRLCSHKEIKKYCKQLRTFTTTTATYN